MHGGYNGFDKALWEAKEFCGRSSAGIDFSYTSKDGEEGFPGNLKVNVRYEFNSANEWKIRYKAKTDKPTHFNPTQHTYFNLNGGKRDILEELIEINSKETTEVDERLIPTGKFAPVSGTAFDFKSPKEIGRDIRTVGGYDINYVLSRKPSVIKKSTPDATAYDSESGIRLEMRTEEPGVQLYTANHFNGFRGKGNTTYNKFYGFCLETQHFPDSPNHPNFPTTLLRPGQTFHSETVYRFSRAPFTR